MYKFYQIIREYYLTQGPQNNAKQQSTNSCPQVFIVGAQYVTSSFRHKPHGMLKVQLSTQLNPTSQRYTIIYKVYFTQIPTFSSETQPITKRTKPNSSKAESSLLKSYVTASGLVPLSQS
jgi:hypothetical protein